MKRLLSVLLAIMCLLFITACVSTTTTTEDETTEDKSVQDELVGTWETTDTFKEVETVYGTADGTQTTTLTIDADGQYEIKVDTAAKTEDETASGDYEGIINGEYKITDDEIEFIPVEIDGLTEDEWTDSSTTDTIDENTSDANASFEPSTYTVKVDGDKLELTDKTDTTKVITLTKAN